MLAVGDLGRLPRACNVAGDAKTGSPTMPACTPPPTSPPRASTTAEAALALAQTIYRSSIEHLRGALQRFVAGEDDGRRVRACYPFVRVRTDTVVRADSRLSYGFVAGPGSFETTLTRPELFGNYYLEQFRLLLRNHGVPIEVGTSTQPIPVHFSLAENDHLEGSLPHERRLRMRDLFDLPDLAAMDDGIANGTHDPQPGEPQPLALFTAPRVDYSLHRLRHYTGTLPEHFQNFVLFTNYQFYIDEFIKLGHELMADPATDYEGFVEPGNVVTRRAGTAPRTGDEFGSAPPRLPQMPGYHLVRPDSSGITHGQHRRRPGQCQDHHRPHRCAAPACLADARPLRGAAQQPAARRLRAGPRLHARRPRARRRPAAVGADPGAGRSAGGAGDGPWPTSPSSRATN